MSRSTGAGCQVTPWPPSVLVSATSLTLQPYDAIFLGVTGNSFRAKANMLSGEVVREQDSAVGPYSPDLDIALGVVGTDRSAKLRSAITVSVHATGC